MKVPETKSVLGVPLPFLFVGAFMIVAPISLGTQLEVSQSLKIIRIAICAIGALIAIGRGSLQNLSRSGWVVLAFSFFYTVAATWSDHPLNGVLYKSLFLSAIVLGIGAGASLSNLKSFRNGLRFIGLVASVAAFITLYEYIRNPVSTTRLGRLALYGINANALGMTAAGYLLVVWYLALAERGLWRILGGVSAPVLLVTLLATGSRAALAMALLGVSIELIPWLRKPGKLLYPALVISLVLVLLSNQLPAEAIERLTDFEENTRSGMWQAGMRLFWASPIVGHGWLTSGRSTSNLQNVYFQILAETGVLGGILLIIAIHSLLRDVNILKEKNAMYARPIFYFAAAFLLALGVHAIAESALLLGSTVNTMFFGLALGMIGSLFRVVDIGNKRAFVPTIDDTSRLSLNIYSYSPNAHPPRHS